MMIFKLLLDQPQDNKKGSSQPMEINRTLTAQSEMDNQDSDHLEGVRRSDRHYLP